jgi:hypothetical protein
MIIHAYDQIETMFPSSNIAMVSGLTAVGVLKIAYEEAVRRGWRTEGVACEKAKDHPLFPVDEAIIHGKNWGDESQIFLARLDGLIRIGNGPQSVRECDEIRGRGLPTLEYNLPTLP